MTPNAVYEVHEHGDPRSSRTDTSSTSVVLYNVKYEVGIHVTRRTIAHTLDHSL